MEHLSEYAREKGLRLDANRLALKAVRSILDAAEPLELTLDGTLVRVEPQRLAPKAWWSRDVMGLDETQDGPWPQAVLIPCSWEGGKTELIASAELAGGVHRDLVSILIATHRIPQQLVWINVAAQLRAKDGANVDLYAWFSLTKRIPDDPIEARRLAMRADALRQLVSRSPLPVISSSNMTAFTVTLPEGAVLPSPREAFRRLVHLALLKLPFIVKNLAEAIDGRPPVHPESNAEEPQPSLWEQLPQEVGDEPDQPDQSELLARTGVDVPPTRWTEELSLSSEHVRPHLGELDLPEALLAQITAALSSGKHILLVGPPGTGKTEIAIAIAESARAQGFCSGVYTATASADWTTFDTIGGYALQQNGSFYFRPGAFLRAIERHQWLLIDELNRADVDRAFGELMTVLAGRPTDTLYALPDGRAVSIGPGAGASHRVTRPFRVLATMNTWDKTSLFRLSYAVQRRFAIIDVGVPSDEVYERVITKHASQKGVDPRLDEAAIARVRDLFRASTLLAHRAVGLAVPVDIVRYLRRRQAGGDGMAEALAMCLLPQLEGLAPDAAAKVFRLLAQAVIGWASPEAQRRLRARYQEFFPHLTLLDA